MKTSNIETSQLIDNFMVTSKGACITFYPNQKDSNLLKQQGINCYPFRLCIVRFKSDYEAMNKYNELIKLRPILWLNGIKQ